MPRFVLSIALFAIAGFLTACASSHSSRPVVVAQPAPAPVVPAAPAPPPEPTEAEQLAFRLGEAMVEDLARYFFTESEVQSLLDGVQAGLDQAEPTQQFDRNDRRDLSLALRELAIARAQARIDDEKLASSAYLDELKQREGADYREEQGIVILDLNPGDGAYPEAEEWVMLHTRATLRDGRVIGDTHASGEASIVQPQYFLPCWNEILPEVRVGGSVSFACPSELVYGDTGRAGTVLPGAMMKFEIEMLEIVDDPAARSNEDQFSEGEKEQSPPAATR